MMSQPPNIVLDPNISENPSRGASPNGPPTPSTPVVHLLSKPKSSQDAHITQTLPPLSSDPYPSDPLQTQPLQFASLVPRPLSAPSNMAPSPSQLAVSAEVDPSIVEALKSSKDRLYVLKLAESMEELIRERPVGSRIDLRPASSYQRLLVHRCAGYYNLQQEPLLHTIGVITATESRIPSKRICELVPSEETPFPTIQIMRRSDRSAKASRTSSRATSTDGDISEEGEAGASSRSQGSGSNANKKKYMTIEEREAAYNEARSRIFEGFEEGASTNGTTSSLSVDGDEVSTAPTESDAAPSPNVPRKDWGYNERRAWGGGRFGNGNGDIPRNQPPTFRGNAPPFTNNGPPMSGPYMGLFDPSVPSASNPAPYDPTAHGTQPPSGPFPYGYQSIYPPNYWPYYPGYYPPPVPPAQQNNAGPAQDPSYGNPVQYGSIPAPYMWPPPSHQQPTPPPPPPPPQQQQQPPPPPMSPHGPPHAQPYPQPPSQQPPRPPPAQAGDFFPNPNSGYPYFPQHQFPVTVPGPQPPQGHQIPPPPPPPNGWMPGPPPQQQQQPPPWNGATANANMNLPPQQQAMMPNLHANHKPPPIRGPWGGHSFGPGVSVAGVPISSSAPNSGMTQSNPNSSTTSLNSVPLGVRSPPEGMGIRVMPPITLPYPPGIGAMGSGYSSGSSSAGSLRKRERTSSAATSASGHGGRADETSSIASSSSSSSKRTYTSTTSSQHPLPERPDWAIQIRPHNVSRTHSHPSHSSFHSSRAASVQGSPAGFLQAKDFPPLGGGGRAPGGRAPPSNGVWGAPRMNANSTCTSSAVNGTTGSCRLEEHDKQFERGAVGKNPGELYNPRDPRRREKEVASAVLADKEGVGAGKENLLPVVENPAASVEGVVQGVEALTISS